MRRKGNLVFLVLALLLTAAPAEVVDRIIAVVNGHLVTWSDLDEQMRFEALENRRALKDLSEAERRSAFEHLVQNRMLRDQMQGMAPATDSEIDARIDELRAAWMMDKGEARWSAALTGYGLSTGELRRLVQEQLEVLQFTEFRVRPLVRVSRAEVDEYYAHVLAPQVKAQGQTPAPVEAVSSKIRELLEEQKMNQEMDKWLETLRTQSRVQVLWDAVR
jgi:peptidyl-prolyl cis-trans isomerase SurA